MSGNKESSQDTGKIKRLRILVAQAQKEPVREYRKRALAGSVALAAFELDPAFANIFNEFLDAALVLPHHRELFELPPTPKDQA